VSYSPFKINPRPIGRCRSRTSAKQHEAKSNFRVEIRNGLWSGTAATYLGIKPLQ